MNVLFSGALSAAGLLLSAAVVSAQTPATTSATSTEASETKTEEKDDGDKVICRAVRETGSRIPSRICRTKDQWAAITKENTDAAENTLNRNSACFGDRC